MRPEFKYYRNLLDTLGRNTSFVEHEIL